MNKLIENAYKISRKNLKEIKKLLEKGLALIDSPC